MFMCMHDLPHCTTVPIHQFMFMFICMFNTYQKIKILTSIKEISKQSKAWKQGLISMDINSEQRHIT